MTKNIRKTFLALIIALTTFVALPATQVHAQVGICDFIGPICEAIGIDDDQANIGVTAENFLASRINLILGLLFVGITLLAIFIIVQAGIKYIQSQGNEEKIQDAQKAIKSVFIGLAILIVGVVGVIIVIIFLGGGSGFFGLNDSDCFNECVEGGKPGSTCITQCQLEEQ